MHRRNSKSIIFFYLLKELSLYFFVSFLFFFFIFFVNNILLLAEDILSKQAPGKEVALLMFYSLPIVIANAVPFAALVGTLMCIGRFVSDLEFLALYSLGFSLRNILIPVLVMGGIISALSFITNDILLPASSIERQKVFWRISTATPSVNIDSYAIKRNDNATLVSGLVQDGTVDPLLIIERISDGKKRIVSAQSAAIKAGDSPAVLMTLSLENARMLMFSEAQRKTFDYADAQAIDYNVLSKDVSSEYFTSIGPGEMASRDLYADIQERKAANDSSQLLYIYNMELQKKFAIPAGAFFFMLLAFAISATGKLANQSIGFILGLLISVAYWSVMMVGQSISMMFGINGTLVVWLPNILLVLASTIFLGRRIIR